MASDRQELKELFEGDSDVKAVSMPHEKGLGKLAKLADEVMNWAKVKERLERELGEANAEIQKRLVVSIPELMNQLKIKKFTMADGTELQVVDAYSAKISEENRKEAFAWLVKNKFGSLIKTMMEVNVGRATPKQLKDLLAKVHQALKEAKIEARPVIDETVHSSTLKAFVKEQLVEGNPRKMPLELFGARSFQLAKITPPKVEEEKK